MRRNLMVLATASMVIGSTAAHAATRPELTRLSPPTASANANASEEEVPLALILLGLGGLLGVLLFAASSNGNSPR